MGITQKDFIKTLYMARYQRPQRAKPTNFKRHRPVHESYVPRNSNPTILTIDPGPPITGLCFYKNPREFKIYSCSTKNLPDEGENWVIHANFIRKEIKALNPEVIGVESGKIFGSLPSGLSHEMDELIKLTGFCQWSGLENGAEVIKIPNQQRDYYLQNYLPEGRIGGLRKERIKKYWDGAVRQSTRGVYVFLGSENIVSVHERDAIIMLYIYITKYLKRHWPFEGSGM